jgi:hypothetical protein
VAPNLLLLQLQRAVPRPSTSTHSLLCAITATARWLSSSAVARYNVVEPNMSTGALAVTQPAPPLHRPVVCTSIAKGAGYATPVPATARMHVLVTRRIAVALARALGRHRPIRNLGSGICDALDSRRPLARGLLLLGGRRHLGLMAACAPALWPILDWRRGGRDGKILGAKKRKGGWACFGPPSLLAGFARRTRTRRFYP